MPRGAAAAQDSTGTLITFDSAAAASRFSINQWIQSGLLTSNIRQVAAVGGNSLSVSGAALTVTKNDRIFLIGSTQPTVSGGSATYTTPNTLIRQRDDDAADLYTNSMITTNSDGLIQGFGAPGLYDVLIQDGNQGNQGSIIDLELGTVQGISAVDWAYFGSTVTIAGQLIVGSTATFGTTTSGGVLSVRGPGQVRYASRFSSGSNTGGIQEAINDLPSQGGKVVLDAGTTYSLTAQIVGVAGLHIQGCGPSSAIVQATGGTSGIVIASRMIVSDLTLRGNGTSATNAHGINGGGTQDSVVERCVVEQWGRIGVNFGDQSSRCVLRNSIVRNNANEGVYFGLTNTDIEVVGNLVYGNSNNGIDCIASRAIIANNVVRNNGTPGLSSDNHGIIVGAAGSSQVVQDVVVSGNVCYGNARDGIFVVGAGASCSTVIIEANDCSFNSVRGIDIAGNVGVTFSNVSVVGNVVRGNSDHGILIDGLDDSSVVGNVIVGNFNNGLYFYATGKNCSRNVATGNIIRGNSNSGIKGDHMGVFGCVVTGNQVTGNGTNIGSFTNQNNLVANNGPLTSTLTQGATLTLTDGDFFGVSGTIGAGTSISNITPAFTGREILLWAAAGTMGFSVSNTLRVIGASFNVPVNGAVKAFCTGTTWFVFSAAS